jgi:hypothetical protein
MMHGFWIFLIVAVVFGSVTSVLRAALTRGKNSGSSGELYALRERMAELEAQQKKVMALLPAHDKDKRDDYEQRLQTLETIVTAADKSFENNLREVAQQLEKKA